MSEIVVSYSELDTFRQCPLKHHWAYKERWRRPVAEDGALAKGSLWHLVMERHYQILAEHERLTPESVAEALEASKLATREFLVDQKTGVQSEVQALIEWIYRGYIERWQADSDWEILGVEEGFQLPLESSVGVDSEIQIKGKIDLVVRDRLTGQLWVVDHKSGSNLPSQMDLEIDDQFGLYSWAMRKLGRPVLGAIHNAARTTQNLADKPGYTGKSSPQTLDQRFSRTFLNRSEIELTNIALDAYNAAAVAYSDQTIYSSPDPRQCGWKCDFKEIHLLARKGRNPHEALSDYGFVQDFKRH